jgi:D-alanyl-D-alanine carboxypeptidase
MHSHSDKTFYVLVAITIVSVLTAGYLLYDQHQKNLQIENLLHERNALLQQNNQKSAEIAVASTTISNLEDQLDNLREDLDDLADDYRDERNRNEDFEDQIRQLSGTLGEIDKLSQIDEELLLKYSRVSFLNENYFPTELEQIDDRYVLERVDDEYFHARAIEFLEDMLRDARRDDIDLKVVSAYRSFDEQNEIKGQFTQVYGEGANTFSADQGFSEHQLGTTVDLTTEEVGGTFETFANTEAYEWLLDNAHEYGFILSYPEGNSFYVFEPWHWRFVGRELAEDLHRDEDLTFYTMDQREINQYRLNFFD